MFQARDGRRVARLYAAAKNRRDSAGRWVPIDASLADRSGRLAPRSSDLNASFAKRADDAAVVTMGAPGRQLRSGIAGAEAVASTVAGDAVVYSDALPGVDVEYATGSGVVKETLILDAAPAPGKATWRFPLSLDPGLTPSMTPTGGISVTDATGTEVAHVPAATMWDSKSDRRSGDPGVFGPANLALEGSAAAGWSVVVSADEKWLRDARRVFPVYVDPSWYVSGAGSDAFVASGFPTRNYNVTYNTTSKVYENRVGRYDATWGEGRTYLKFDLTPVKGATIDQAWFNGYFFHTYTVAPTMFRVQHLNGPWSATSVTWNGQPAWGGAYVDGSVGRGQWGEVNLTAMVSNQASGAWPDHGYVVTAGTATSNFKRMASMENTNGTAPYLEVHYNRPRPHQRSAPGPKETRPAFMRRVRRCRLPAATSMVTPCSTPSRSETSRLPQETS